MGDRRTQERRQEFRRRVCGYCGNIGRRSIEFGKTDRRRAARRLDPVTRELWEEIARQNLSGGFYEDRFTRQHFFTGMRSHRHWYGTRKGK